MTIRVNIPENVICPLIHSPGKQHSCKKEHCAWYIKYTSVMDTEESGCAITKIALSLITKDVVRLP